MKHPAKTDIAVLLLFFTRSDTFAQVFEAVRQARPSKLFLYQDGPRGEQDMAGIMACREIVSDAHIDWECEVHRQYLEHNQGCDPSGFRSHPLKTTSYQPSRSSLSAKRCSIAMSMMSVSR